MKKLKHGSEGNVISHFERARRYGAGVLCAVLVVGAAGCKSETAPQYDVSGTGGLQGLLFLDVNHDGLFDPSAGDSVLPNVRVIVQERGTTSTIAGGTATTDAFGRFSIASLPIGTHALAIDTAGLGTRVVFCQNPIPFDTHLAENQFVALDGRTGCLITIAAAEAKSLNAPITVSGTVTSSTGQFAANITYIEDATGGIQIFGASLGTVAIGDVIEVQGVLGSFRNETQVGSPKLNSTKPGTPLTPFATTTKDVEAAGASTTANLQGRLVKVSAAKVTVSFVGNGGGRNASIDDGSGPTTIRLETVPFPDATGFATKYAVGKCFDIIGIPRAFTSPLIELEPRSANDIVEVTCKP